MLPVAGHIQGGQVYGGHAYMLFAYTCYGYSSLEHNSLDILQPSERIFKKYLFRAYNNLKIWAKKH